MEGLIVFAVMALVLLLIPVILHNSLVAKRNQVRNIFATLDAMLKKRWDLVPNLAATVKGYAEHERGLFEQVVQLRSQAMEGRLSDDQKVGLDNAMTRLLGVVRGVVEQYPQLKAGENFMHLQRTLTELEEQISAARRAYNASVTDYNNAVEMFPTSLIAGLFGFQRKDFFAIHEIERAVPDAGRFLHGEKGR